MTQRRQDGVAIIVGLYVFFSPWIISYFWPTSSISILAQWSHVGVGIVVVIAGIAAIVSAQAWEEYLIGLFGLWLLISPWLLDFSRVAAFAWNAVIAGVIIIALAIGNLFSIRHYREYGA